MYRWKHLETYYHNDFTLCSIWFKKKIQSSYFFEFFIEMIILQIKHFHLELF
jgi:hypothetical protein